MTSETNRHDTDDHDDKDEKEDSLGTASESSQEPVGAETGMTEAGTTFEPEEDPDGAAE